MSREARDLARRAIGEKSILDAAEKLHAQTRAELAGELEAGDRVTIKDAEGTTLGLAYVSDPAQRWKVTDPALLLAWAKEHAPHLVVSRVVEEVPSLPLDDQGEIALPTGECVRPDGVSAVRGRPTLTVKPSDAAKALALSLVTRELES